MDETMARPFETDPRLTGGGNAFPVFHISTSQPLPLAEALSDFGKDQQCNS